MVFPQIDTDDNTTGSLDWMNPFEAEDPLCRPSFDNASVFEAGFDDAIVGDSLHFGFEATGWTSVRHDNFLDTPDFPVVMSGESPSQPSDYSDEDGSSESLQSSYATPSTSSTLEDEFRVRGRKRRNGILKQTSKQASKQIRRLPPDLALGTLDQVRSEEIGEPPQSRRNIHNVLERKRRNDLKLCYQDLRDTIPDLEANERASTGTILARAAQYVRSLQEEERVLVSAVMVARQQNAHLRSLLLIV